MYDLAVFAALDFERRAVIDGLRSVAPAGRPRTWRGYTADGASCLVVQTGIGPIRARSAAEAAPPAGAYLMCGCAGALAPSLAPGDLVVADRVDPLDGEGSSTRRRVGSDPRVPSRAWRRAPGSGGTVPGWHGSSAWPIGSSVPCSPPFSARVARARSGWRLRYGGRPRAERGEGSNAISAAHRDRHDPVADEELVGGQQTRARRPHARAAPYLQPSLSRVLARTVHG